MTGSASDTIRPHQLGLLLLLGILWGIPYGLTKVALDSIPPLTLTAARVSLAAMALWIVAFVLGRKVPKRWDFAGHVFIQGSICVLGYTLVALGQQSVDSGLTAILNSTTPLFVCLIGVTWTRHESITVGRLAGALIGLGGVVVIVGAGALLGIGKGTAGQAAIVLATFLSAVSVVHGRRFSAVEPELVAAGMLTCAAVVLVPISLVVEAPWRLVPSAKSLAALGANAVLATALGFVIYFYLIRTIGSMGTASASYLKPCVGVLIGCLLIDEPLTWSLGVGFAAILLGVAVINDKTSLHLLLSTIRPLRTRLQRREPAPSIAQRC